MPIAERGDRRNLGDQPNHRDVPLGLVENVARGGIERRQRGYGAVEHRNRLRIVAESLEEIQKMLVDIRVLRGVVCEMVVRALVRKLSLMKEPGVAEKRGGLGEL